MIRDDATEAQVRAANPAESTWLAANAGSGKTRVLTDRVARLLLDGVSPEHILCLTYTKAAATEMQNRLFRRLGQWAMLDSGALREALRALGADADLSDDFLRDARTLFARAIETPGGLRIQTIHSFCASLLRRFPLEARVSPQFKEMEDRAAELLRADILDQMADGPEAPLVRSLAPHISGDDPAKLLAEITRNREAFVSGPDDAGIRAAYGLKPGMDEAAILASVFLGDEMAFLAEMVPVLETSGTNDKKLAEVFKSLTGPDLQSLELLEGALLTGSSAKEPFAAKIGSVPTKSLLKIHPLDHIMPRLEALMLRVEDTRKQRLALAAVQRDLALYNFARHFIPAYEEAKLQRGWLDFDDLITRARDLLSDPAVAEWVLYRLDGGIDHILVDEAQDTSPVQWQVIERLAQEFTAGIGARAEVRRTIFVVGDKKQSIYSFQGADPTEFDRMRDDFAERLRRTDAPLSSMALQYSFRSAEPILRVVDNTFEHAAESGFEADQKHRAFKQAMPGRVDLWPVVESVKDDSDDPWFEPVDRVGSQHHSVILANRIAHFIKTTIGTPLPVEIGNTGTYQTRPAHAGDFLILVRGRQRLFEEIIRACKQAEIPIAGADRLKVMAELAVRDIVALLSFLATQEDDLSLATALRSPLFGLSEQQLFDLAHRRGRAYLWETLRDRQAEFPDAFAILTDLRNSADFLRPFDLIDRILTRFEGRRRLIGRLGPEAEDGINALLGQALSYEQTDVPSLTGFLHWVQTDDLEIKRAAEGAGRTLRVMTVHGAKGLEAPIVIMPDCADPRSTIKESLLRDDAGVLWKQGSAQLPERQVAALDAAKAKQARERDRLLYVGLTRAEKWLVVAAAGDLGKQGNAWHEKVQRGMVGAGAVPRIFDFGDWGSDEGLRAGQEDWSHLPLIDMPQTAKQAEELPEHLKTPAPVAPEPAKTRKPSDLGGAKALPSAEGDTEEIAKARGTAIHLLLEMLAPLDPATRDQASETLLEHLRSLPDLAPAEPLLPAILQEALTVLATPALASFFAADTLAEVAITADLPGLGRIHGVIDRLLITGSHVTAVDFKSNRAIPARPEQVPEGLLRQMGAYAAALQQLYPGHRIDTGLIWTADPHYMPLPHDLVTQALGRAAAS